MHLTSSVIRTKAAPLSRHLAVAAVCGLLSGCMVGPDYTGPPIAAPVALKTGSFHRGQLAPVTADDPPAQWWLSLDDPELTRLIDAALVASPNLLAAEARVREARASLTEQRTGLLPTGGASAAYARVKLPDTASSILGGAATPTTASGGAQKSGSSSGINLFSVGFDAVWEADIFGGTRRGIEGAKATAQAQVASYDDVQVELASEVAQAYVNLRDRQHRVELGRGEGDMDNRLLQLTLRRRAGGAASDGDVERARTQLGQTQADLVPLRAQVDQYLDELALLTGREAGQLDAELAEPAPTPMPPRSVAIGDPAATIRRRPDIRQAERRLAAANAAIGQNVAEYFPSVSLTGAVGYGATDISHLFSGASLGAVGAPLLSWNLLNFPKIAAEVRGAKAKREEAEASYRQTVLAALEDAEASLSRFGHQRETVAQLSLVQDSATRAAAITRRRYAGGTASLIDVLDTDRQNIVAEQSLTQSKAMLTNDYVALQKSLGLGWRGPTQQ